MYLPCITYIRISLHFRGRVVIYTQMFCHLFGENFGDKVRLLLLVDLIVTSRNMIAINVKRRNYLFTQNYCADSSFPSSDIS